VRIGIDGYNLAVPTGTGVATYGRGLAAALKAGGHRVEGVFGLDAGRDPATRETLFFDRFGRGLRVAGLGLAPAYQPWLRARAVDVPLTGLVDTRALADRWPAFDRVVTAPGLFALAHRYFATFRRFVPLRMADPPAVMHWTYPVPIELVGARNIYTLHDLVPLKLPFATLTAKRTYHALVAGCIARGRRICTVSETSRTAIVGAFGLDPAQVVNCYQAVPPSPLAEPADGPALHQMLGLAPGGYFLFFGAIEPKKNVGRLVEAHLSRATDTPLVIVGSPGWQGAGETRLLRADPDLGQAHAGRLAARVIRLDHLPRDLLARLVRNARAVTFPSIAEGFGLPIAEAMAAGTPVLTARGGATEEVAGGAALLVDPFDVGDIARGLAALDEDAALRARLTAAGLERAGHFSPERFLKRLERMYADVLA